jgi:hypothetical protein
MLIYQRRSCFLPADGDLQPPAGLRGEIERENATCALLRGVSDLEAKMVEITVYDRSGISGGGSQNEALGPRPFVLDCHQDASLDDVTAEAYRHICRNAGKEEASVVVGVSDMRQIMRLRGYDILASQKGATYSSDSRSATSLRGLGLASDSTGGPGRCTLCFEIKEANLPWVEFDPHEVLLEWGMWKPNSDATSGFDSIVAGPTKRSPHIVAGKVVPYMWKPNGPTATTKWSPHIVAGGEKATLKDLETTALAYIAKAVQQGPLECNVTADVSLTYWPKEGTSTTAVAYVLMDVQLDTSSALPIVTSVDTKFGMHQLLTSLRIKSGDRIMVEVERRDSGSTVPPSFPHAAQRHHDEATNIIVVEFNTLDTPAAVDQTLTIDRRLTLCDLKQAIATHLHLAPAEGSDATVVPIHLKRNARGPQLRNGSVTLEKLGFFTGKSVYVGKGRTLEPGEVLLNFSLHHDVGGRPVEGPSSPFFKLFRMAVHENCKVLELKQKILDKLIPAKAKAAAASPLQAYAMESLSLAHIRVRDKSGQDLGKIFRDHKTLKQSLPAGKLMDGKDICFQILGEPETLGDRDVLVRAHFLSSPKSGSSEVPTLVTEERVVDKSWSMDMLCDTLRQRLHLLEAPEGEEGRTTVFLAKYTATSKMPSGGPSPLPLSVLSKLTKLQWLVLDHPDATDEEKQRSPIGKARRPPDSTLPIGQPPLLIRDGISIVATLVMPSSSTESPGKTNRPPGAGAKQRPAGHQPATSRYRPRKEHGITIKTKMDQD